MKITQLIVFVSFILTMSSCLNNLNVSEFFRKLEIKSPETYELVYNKRDLIEQQIKDKINEYAPSGISRITFWGEGRYACGRSVDVYSDMKDYVLCLGTISYENSDRVDNYLAYFQVDEDGTLINLSIQ